VTPARCLYCGRRPIEMHHITGRTAAQGPYCDPKLVLPLCKRHHSREHEILGRRRLSFPRGADLLGHRLARALDFLGRVADHGRPLVIDGDALDALHALFYEASTGLSKQVSA
jgi:hypothetical protein